MNSPTTVFLHIGHGKTGTSAFQAYLASAKSFIESAGYCYPSHHSIDAAQKLKVTSGNLSLGSDHDKKNWLQEQVIDVIQNNQSFSKFIFSNETVFHFLAPLLNSSTTLLQSNIKIVILLSVRNPLDMIESEYQQLVKRHGYTKSIDSFASSRQYRCIHTCKSAELISKFESLGISYRLFNYSRLSKKIASALATSIGIEFTYPSDSICSKTVNRSLSASELQHVIFFNQFFGQKLGTHISNRLIEEFPNVEREQIAFSNTTIEKIRQAMMEPVSCINQRLQPSDNLTLDYDNTSAIKVSSELPDKQLLVCSELLEQYISLNTNSRKTV